MKSSRQALTRSTAHPIFPFFITTYSYTHLNFLDEQVSCAVLRHKSRQNGWTWCVRFYTPMFFSAGNVYRQGTKLSRGVGPANFSRHQNRWQTPPLPHALLASAISLGGTPGGGPQRRRRLQVDAASAPRAQAGGEGLNASAVFVGATCGDALLRVVSERAEAGSGRAPASGVAAFTLTRSQGHPG